MIENVGAQIVVRHSSEEVVDLMWLSNNITNSLTHFDTLLTLQLNAKAEVRQKSRRGNVGKEKMRLNRSALAPSSGYGNAQKWRVAV